MRTVHRSLVPGAHFVFTIEHPIYMAAAHPHWLSDEEGRKTWPVNRYALEGERRTDWLAKGVLKHHRRIGTTLNTLIARSEEHTSELQSLMRISYAVFCLKKKKTKRQYCTISKH